ncbi:MarR family winged helix-turn-helix transcriptional regulator [Pseudonocardia acaciae]|uniref:MarR family winged helix-turn-helix transcriptional regulator n=1 Tax=Pseudonocardia acaciae TaxID=551276 RepID=UPI0004907450|nr:MarR family transcriptional regulator [Pseudonocardia acaciae]
MVHTRWLDDEEQHAWRAFLAANKLLMDRLDRQLQNEAGIPHTYYEILVRLSEVPDRALRMSVLATSSMSSRSRLSHAVSRLEEAGWVRRRECTEDRRGAVCELTDAGFEALKAAAPGHVDTVRTYLFDQLTREQVHQLRAISEAVAKGLGGGDTWPLGDNVS